MLLSTQTDYFQRKYGDIAAVRRLKAAGFDAMDFSLFAYPIHGEVLSMPLGDQMKYFGQLKAVADEEGILFGQIHSPFPTYINGPEDSYIFEKVAQSMAICAVLGSPYNVVHPNVPKERIYDQFKDECWELNRDFYSRLIPFAKDAGVKIAVENMFNRDPILNKYCPTVVSTGEELCAYIDRLNEIAQEEVFVACLDVGHALITDDTPEHMICQLGDRLQVLHIQDNNGIRDAHTMPYMGRIDWNEVAKALKEVNYRGTFSLEADNTYRVVGKECDDITLAFMQAVGRSIIAKTGL